MNIKNISFFIFSVATSFLFSSCNDNNTTNSYESSSKDAQIYSFTMTAAVPEVKDSLHQVHLDSLFKNYVNKAKFAIDQVSGTIYNPDSMPYGVFLEKAYLSMTFNSMGISELQIYTPDSIDGYSWNFTDSVDVSKQPIQFKVTAPDAISSKQYKLDIRIHKIDPDTILWNQMTSYPVAIGQSKTLLYADSQFYTYTIVNGTLKLYTSSNSNLSWKSETVSGLSTVLNVESIFVLNNTFYGVDGQGKSYKSTDGKLWAEVSNTSKVESIIGVLPGVNRTDDQLLLIINQGTTKVFAKTKNMSDVEIVTDLSFSPSENSVPSEFPVKGFSSYTIYSSDANEKMLTLAGGVDKNGKDITYSWLVNSTEKGLEISPDRGGVLPSSEGLSLFKYDNKMYVLSNDQFYISSIWGQTWVKAPNKQKLSPDMIKRKGQTVIVDSNNYIWIFGGVSAANSYMTDVWRGRLNSLIP